MKLTVEQALQKGIEAHREGKVREADQAYTAILRIQPNHPDANHNLGVLCMSIENFDQALIFLERALDAKPTIKQFWLSYINVLIKTENFEKAKNILSQAEEKGFEIDGFEELKEKKKSKTNIKLGDPSPKAIKNLINLYNQGKFQLSLNKAKELLRDYPNSINLINIIGGNYLGLGDYESSIKEYKKAISIKPDYVEAINNIGIALNKKGEQEEAINSYKEAISIEPNFPEAYFNLANILKDQGKLEEAIDYYKKVISLKANYVDAYNNLGNAYKAQGKLNKSIELYKKALSVNPKYIKPLNNIGNSLQELGKLEEARKIYEKVLSISPDYIDAYNNLGVTLKEQGNFSLAIEAYNKAILLNPKSEQVYYNLGNIFLETGNYNKSVDSFNNAINNSIDNPKILESSQNMLLKALYYLNNKEKFYSHLQKLVDLGKSNAIIGSLACRANHKYHTEIDNLFCNKPMDYIIEKSLLGECDFEKDFIKETNNILQSKNISKKNQSLLNNGYQTAGNIFADNEHFKSTIKNIIDKEITNYRNKFIDSSEGFLKKWPERYQIRGWIINMSNGGSLKSHMHENGWLSGSIYINVPKIKNNNSGNLVVGIEEENNEKGNNKSNNKIINVETGSLCLFPSSLNHYTIPFNSKEERIVLAFDIEAKKN